MKRTGGRRTAIAEALLGGWLTWLLGVGSSMGAEPARDTSEHLERHRREQSLRQADETRWRSRHEALRDGVVQDRARLEQALAAYNRTRRPGRERDGARTRAAQEREAARRALAETESELAAFLEEAHRAGVPPGWLRPAETDGDAADESSEERRESR